MVDSPLKLVASQSPERGISTRFFMEADYAFGYLLLSASCGEAQILGGAIRSVVQRLGLSRRGLLDIGCADGRLTGTIASLFGRLTAYEPNPVLFSLCKSRFAGDEFPAVIWPRAFSRLTAPAETFSLGLVSHSLYHVDRAEWAEFFETLRRNIAPNGCLCVVLWSKLSDAYILSAQAEPARWLCTSDDLLSTRGQQMLAEVGLRLVAHEQVRPTIRSHSEEAARLVADFLLGNSARRSLLGRGASGSLSRTLCGRGVTNATDLMFLRPR